jgi:hypothetical protein
MTNIVSGGLSTVTDLGKDDTWMASWLTEQPERMGLGELEVAEGAADDDDRSFVATDDDRCFSVDVQLGEMEASRGFGVLDNWARNRVLHPDKSHVAVLVTEVVSDRYRTTLEALAEHLPLVVVELQVWKGENEAIVVPHVAVASENVDLADTPAARAAEVVASNKSDDATSDSSTDADEAASDDESADPMTEAEAETAEAEADADAEAEVSDKDDTGVGNPWGLANDEDEDDGVHASGAGSTGLLTKVG